MKAILFIPRRLKSACENEGKPHSALAGAENIEKDTSKVKIFGVRADEESAAADNAYKLITCESEGRQ